MAKDVNKSKVYQWTAKAFTQHSKEISYLLKYGTPSDTLIQLADTTGFPYSLNKRSGQVAIYNAAVRISTYIKTVPVQAYALYLEIKDTLRHRRKDTLSNYLMVAEAVCHRAASEFKHEVLFAFDSVIEWVKSVYDKDLGYLTIRRALESLDEAGFFKVREWGIRGNRTKCTKIEILTSRRNYILTYTSKVDEWLMNLDHGMMKVYARESTTRQDVLEQRIHHFADQVVQDDSRYLQGYRLFPTADAKLAEETTEVVVKSEEVLWDDVYIDRLLGGLVPTLQAHGSNSG